MDNYIIKKRLLDFLNQQRDSTIIPNLGRTSHLFKIHFQEEDMNGVIENIISRRSIRKFAARQIEEKLLEEILLAGSYAPNAGGRQSPLIVVCQNEKINNELGEINFEANRQITNRPVDPGTTKAPEPSQTAATVVSGNAFYGAPTVITIFAPKDWYNFTIDCAVAAQNMILAAHSFGIASCIIARAKETFETEAGKKYKHEWNIEDMYEGKIHVLLGYGEGEIPAAKARREGNVVIIR
jgi:nitroreductase